MVAIILKGVITGLLYSILGLVAALLAWISLLLPRVNTELNNDPRGTKKVWFAGVIAALAFFIQGFFRGITP